MCTEQNLIVNLSNVSFFFNNPSSFDHKTDLLTYPLPINCINDQVYVFILKKLDSFHANTKPSTTRISSGANTQCGKIPVIA